MTRPSTGQFSAAVDRRTSAPVGLAALDPAKPGFCASGARALRWENIDLDAVRPHVEIWRSVRAHHDVKTDKSRTLDCSASRQPSCEPISQSFVAHQASTTPPVEHVNGSTARPVARAAYPVG
jgi:hypothetical protein